MLQKLKRLKIKFNFFRNNYHGYFKTYICSEMGEDTLRPHFHLLIFGENSPETYSLFKSAVMSSWKMCDKARWSKGFQLAEDATSYVSSYVNKPLIFHNFFFPIISRRNIPFLRIWVSIVSRILWLPCFFCQSGNMQYSRD